MYPHFMGRARRRCGTSVPSRCLPRRSWPSSSWTATDLLALTAAGAALQAFCEAKPCRRRNSFPPRMSCPEGVPMKCIRISWGGQEEDAEPRYRPGAYRSLHGRPQAGQRLTKKKPPAGVFHRYTKWPDLLYGQAVAQAAACLFFFCLDFICSALTTPASALPSAARPFPERE